jgi:hypothetical protein
MWSIARGPEPQRLPGGQDGEGFLWGIGRDDGERRTVCVEISRTALASSGLPSPVAEAVDTKGATAVLGVVHWVEPPDVITVDTIKIRAFPGSPDPGAT